MLISAGEAARLLTTCGISRQQSRRVLLTGLAGAGVCTRGSLLYDGDRVFELAGRLAADQKALLAACPGGVLVARPDGEREVTVLATWDDVAASLRVQPDLGLAAWLQVEAYLELHHRLAFVATVGGFPVLLADVVSLGSPSDRRLELTLEPAGPWRRLVDRRRLVTEPGPPWLLLGHQHQHQLGRAGWTRERAEPVGAGRETTWSRWA